MAVRHRLSRLDRGVTMSSPHCEELYRGFQWQVPGHFNFAVDVIDTLGRDRGHTALYRELAGQGHSLSRPT